MLLSVCNLAVLRRRLDLTQKYELAAYFQTIFILLVS